ncbi:MAG: CocE/NonD family hydrolase [Bacteroidales bacterium]|nr:CocE/NonD family hydrolase [Bacteroidales bacterium]HOY39217.1 CocE/NonD family hydrolase [Bacteroidales bacterium]
MFRNVIVLIILLGNASCIFSQPLTPVSVQIQMRDDKFLAADVYIPQPQQPRPTILIQTPYNKNLYRWSLPLGFGVLPDLSPYNFVIVDWRGFYGSAAAFVAQYDRGLDGYDCIEWITQQSWSNGEIGTWGPSALGKIQFMTAKHQHPAHKCMVPLVASPEYLYEEYYPGGVYREEYVEQLDALGYGMSTTLMAHPYYDFVWQYTQNQNNYPQLISIPCLMISGWFDHDANMKIDYHKKLCNEAESSVRDKQWLIMGPWVHGGHGSSMVGSDQQGELSFPEAAGVSDVAALKFFGYYLLNAYNAWESTPKVQYFLMGENIWLDAEEWPPPGEIQVENYYLTETGELRKNIVLPSNSFSGFSYDPRDPSPTWGGPTLRNDLLQGPYDQVEMVESRNDILVFTTSQLSEDVVVIGRPRVRLYVSSNCADTDIAVRLTDVYPDGSSILLLDDIFRMRFLNGFSEQDVSFLQTGTIYEVEIEMSDIAICFQAGHYIRLDITGSNWPRFQRNKNTDAAPFAAGDTLISNTRVYHQTNAASCIELPISFQNIIKDIPANSIDVYPNPANNRIYLKSSSNCIIRNVELYDIQGEKRITSAENSIDISTVLPGIYFLKIFTDDGVIGKRFIKY